MPPQPRVMDTLLGQAWASADEPTRAALARLLNSYGQLLMALGSTEPARLSAETSAQQVSAWLASIDQARASVNGPYFEQLYQSSASAPPWPAVIGAWQAREVAVASALQNMQDAYATLRALNTFVSSQVSDEALRAWAWDRVAREQATGPGAGTPAPGAPRARRSRGAEVVIFMLLAWLAMGGGSRGR